MHATRTRLADGRELIYYDERPGVERSTRDTRPLPAPPTSSTIRLDPLLGDWVIVAGHRQDRIHLPSATDCPLCPSGGGRASEIPASDYEVAVFENRFPALCGSPRPGFTSDPATLEPRQDFVERPGTGRCEVICFTSDHDASFADLSPSRVRLVVDVWADRTAELTRLPGIEQVFCFENRGREIGVTESHPHGQVYAYPFVTPRTATMCTTNRDHRARTGGNLFDDVVASELAGGERVVASSDHWISFVPFAARWPYEVHLYPRQRVPTLADLDAEARDDLARAYQDLLGRFDRLFDRPAPYIAAWHQAPAGPDRDSFALHLELFTVRRGPDKLKHLAGSEAAMDVFVGDVVPEDAARRLRELG